MAHGWPFDIRKRYRRSVLGPFWITISLGAFILGLGFIYSPLVGGGISASAKRKSASGWTTSSLTELGPFIDMPFRAYSAGMRPRLDFAISTAIQAEILLLDEGLGAGDASFIEKANERLSKLAEAAGIIVVATHSEELLRKTCTRAALMEAGRILATGSVEEVLELYHTSLAA